MITVILYEPDGTEKKIAADKITRKKTLYFGNSYITLVAHWRDKATHAPCSIDVTRVSRGLYREITE